MAVTRRQWMNLSADELVERTHARALRKLGLRRAGRVGLIVLAGLLASSPLPKFWKQRAASEAERREMRRRVNEFVEGKNFAQVLKALNELVKDPRAVGVLGGLDLHQRIAGERAALESLGVKGVDVSELGGKELTLWLVFSLTPREDTIMKMTPCKTKADVARLKRVLAATIRQRLRGNVAAVKALFEKHLNAGPPFKIRDVTVAPYRPLSHSMTQTGLAGVIQVRLTQTTPSREFVP